MIGNYVGLWMLSAVAVFLLIYFRRPKPYRQILPSLMFLFNDRQKTHRFRFLRNFFSNLLFFLQLLAIILLSLVATEPSITRPFETKSAHTVIVIDTSASMQASAQGASTRFETAIDTAKDYLSKTNTLITGAEPVRAILLRKSAAEAKRELNTLRVSESTTNLADAIILAKEQLGGDSGRIVILSDFAITDISSVLVAKQAVIDDKTTLTFVPIGTPVPNIGFIDLEAQPGKLGAKVRNFNQKAADITITYKQDQQIIQEQKITLAPLSEEVVNLEPRTGKSQIVLSSSSDGFLPDNTLYALVPQESQLKILVITNAQSTTFLEQAILATQKATLSRAIPPVVPDFSSYDIVILHEFNENVLLPGTFEDLKRFRDNGGGVIVGANSKLTTLDTVGILPVKVKTLNEQSSTISSGVSHPLTKDTEFGESTTYFLADAQPSTLIIAKAEDQTPIIALKERVLYYGLNDHQSSFHSKLSYPIFWLKVLNTLHQSADMSVLHQSTGATLSIGEEKAQDPHGNEAQGFLILYYAGYYKKEKSELVANLLDTQESQISPTETILTSLQEDTTQDVTTMETTNLEAPLIILGGLLLLMEWFILKRRGSV